MRLTDSKLMNTCFNFLVDLQVGLWPNLRSDCSLEDDGNILPARRLLLCELIEIECSQWNTCYGHLCNWIPNYDIVLMELMTLVWVIGAVVYSADLVYSSNANRSVIPSEPYVYSECMHAVPVTIIHALQWPESSAFQFFLFLSTFWSVKGRWAIFLQVCLAMLAKECDVTSATDSKHLYIMTYHTHCRKWYDMSSI